MKSTADANGIFIVSFPLVFIDNIADEQKDKSIFSEMKTKNRKLDQMMCWNSVPNDKVCGILVFFKRTFPSREPQRQDEPARRLLSHEIMNE